MKLKEKKEMRITHIKNVLLELVKATCCCFKIFLCDNDEGPEF